MVECSFEAVLNVPDGDGNRPGGDQGLPSGIDRHVSNGGRPLTVHGVFDLAFGAKSAHVNMVSHWLTPNWLTTFSASLSFKPNVFTNRITAFRWEAEIFSSCNADGGGIAPPVVL